DPSVDFPGKGGPPYGPPNFPGKGGPPATEPTRVRLFPFPGKFRGGHSTPKDSQLLGPNVALPQQGRLSIRPTDKSVPPSPTCAGHPRASAQALTAPGRSAFRMAHR